MAKYHFTLRELQAMRAAASGYCEDCDSQDAAKHHKHIDSAIQKMAALTQEEVDDVQR